MDELRRVAELSVGRACAFAGLGIATLMVGLSFDPTLAAKSGAILLMFGTAVLRVKAWHALRQNYRQTELWLMLDKKNAPPEAYAQRMVADVLHDTYVRFSDGAAILALGFWIFSGLLWLAGF